MAWPNGPDENPVAREVKSKWWTVRTYYKKSCEQIEYFVQREGTGRITVRDGFRWCEFNVETNDGEFPRFEFREMPGGDGKRDSLDMYSLGGDNIETCDLVSMDDGGCWGGWEIEGVSEEEEEKLNEFLEENGSWALEDDGEWYLDETEVWVWGPILVIDEDGNECPDGVPGDVALHRLNQHGEPDPIFFLGYWKNPRSTQGKFTGDWCRTGDLAVRDADGYLWYQGRADDVFKAAGYRIGPSEVENCLVKHPAVANAAVVPKPDPERGALVKAYVVLAPGFQASEALIADLQTHVRGKLAPYEYPKEIEFIAELPMTTTGKVQRRVLRLQEEERAALQARH